MGSVNRDRVVAVLTAAGADEASVVKSTRRENHVIINLQRGEFNKSDEIPDDERAVSASIGRLMYLMDRSREFVT